MKRTIMRKAVMLTLMSSVSAFNLTAFAADMQPIDTNQNVQQPINGETVLSAGEKTMLLRCKAAAV